MHLTTVSNATLLSNLAPVFIAAWLWGAHRVRFQPVFLFGMVMAFVRKEKAADNPWGAGATTLEWTLSSPPPFHQFEVLPQVR